MDLVRGFRVEVLIPSTKAETESFLYATGLSVLGDVQSTVTAVVNRDFAFAGERVRVFLVVGGEENKDEAFCRQLKILVNVQDPSSQCGAVKLCPNQPPYTSIHHSFAAASAVYSFELVMASTVFGSGENPGATVDLDIHVRAKTLALLSQTPQRAAIQSMKNRNDDLLLPELEDAQFILNNPIRDVALKSRTRQIQHVIKRVLGVSVRSRYELIDNSCFVHLSCENVSDFVSLTVQDMTLHASTKHAVKIIRIGKWPLPVTLAPKHSLGICFVMKNTADAGFIKEHQTINTAIATLTWSSSVTVSKVTGRHRIEWMLPNPSLGPLKLNLSSIKEYSVGQIIQGYLRIETLENMVSFSQSI